MNGGKTDTVLTINAGSSSVKFKLFAFTKDLAPLAEGKVSGIGTSAVFEAGGKKQNISPGATHEAALRAIIEWVHAQKGGWRISAAAHRIVHGGTEFTAPVRINADVFHRLKQLCPLAPLHQPHNLAAVGIADSLLPQVPQIACFDTAFHAKHDPLFALYALPQELANKGVRRYGFHGLSYEWIAHVLRRDHAHLAKGRVIVAHLGNGASLCAMKNCQSVDTTMGMTALEGLPMGTRSGSLDPGAVLYMIRDLGMAPGAVEHVLYEQSGLKGLSGLTNDVAELLKSKDPRAKFALDYFALRAAQFMAAMAVSIGGVDGIVFTGGIGENAAPVREAIIHHLDFLGPLRALVIPANEECAMAMQALACLHH